MSVITYKVNMKIISVGKVDFDEWDLERVKKLDCTLFIYSYETAPYEGSGFAAWKNKDGWHYDYLGHCSCNGPLENMSKAGGMTMTFEQLEKIAKEDTWGKEVLAYIIKKKLQ